MLSIKFVDSTLYVHFLLTCKPRCLNCVEDCPCIPYPKILPLSLNPTLTHSVVLFWRLVTFPKFGSLRITKWYFFQNQPIHFLSERRFYWQRWVILVVHQRRMCGWWVSDDWWRMEWLAGYSLVHTVMWRWCTMENKNMFQPSVRKIFQFLFLLQGYWPPKSTRATIPPVKTTYPNGDKNI